MIIFLLLLFLAVNVTTAEEVNSLSKNFILDEPTINIESVPLINCAGEIIYIVYTVTEPFLPDNIFTAQLSDENGDFSNPDNIGTLNEMNSGTIQALLPKTLLIGNAYRIRIVTSNPIVQSDDNGENIIINELPVLNVTGNSTPCAGETYSYSTSTESEIEYKWKVTAGDIQGNDNTANIDITWDIVETGYITLIKTNTFTGCTDSAIYVIDIKMKPATEIGWGDYEVCLGEIVEYRAATSPISLNNWQVIGGTLLEGSNVIKAIVRWDNPGIGSIELIKTNEFGCIGRDLREVIVHPRPSASISGSDNVCENNLSSYNTNNSTGLTNIWTVIGGVITGDSSAEIINVLWENEGNGNVQLVQIDIETKCSDTAIKEVSINPMPQLEEISGELNVCEYSIKTYRIEDINNADLKWYIIGGEIIGPDNDNILQVNWGDVGSGRVTYIASFYSSGCNDSLSLDILINKSPDVSLEDFDDVCINDHFFLLSSGSPSGGDYSGIGVQEGYFAPKVAGVGKHNITYSYTNSSGCSNSSTKSITVNQQPPKPTVTKEDNKLVSSADMGNQWFLNSEIIEGAINKTILIDVNGIYTVQVTDENGCMSDISEGIEVIVGVEDAFGNNTSVTIFPNPAEKFVMIDFENDCINRAKILISDVLGNTVYSKSINKEFCIQRFRIDISNFNSGIYLINIYFSDMIISKKIIVRR